MALLSLAGCSVPIKEETLYTDAGDQGAVISHFFSTDSSVIGKSAWDSMREGMTCMGPDAIGDIKTEIEKLCSKVSCSQQDNPDLWQLRDLIDRIQVVQAAVR